MERMRGRQEDHAARLRDPVGKGDEKEPRPAPSAPDEGGVNPDPTDGPLGKLGTEGIPSDRKDSPEREPGAWAGQERTEPSGRVGP
jgi:hypothetical protein